MAFSRFQAMLLAQVVALVATLEALVWMIGHTRWHLIGALGVGLIVAQAVLLTRFASRSAREVARFLDAVAFDESAASFASLQHDPAFAELGAAMTKVVERLHAGRAAREEQAQYFQTLLAHVPVSLVVVDEQGRLDLLNRASRRLFETPCATLAECARHGPAFAAGLEGLKPGGTAVLPMVRRAGDLQLKAAATGVSLAGKGRTLISLQNIQTELTAHELAAWQTVIRVMAHEVTNSLTPISSMAATARDRVLLALDDGTPEEARQAALTVANDALETVARRSRGLLHFVQNHRRLTRRLEVQIGATPLSRVFARIERLFLDELEARGITLTLRVEPPTLELAVDGELLDQALINLLRNAIEALRDRVGGQITLAGRRDDSGHVVLVVSDNGPGISIPNREKVFIPFFTTKRQGSGVGLTLVRQIAAAHNASVRIAEAAEGGAAVHLVF
jgi:two-component system nitrogen regulation sensor histidine kinase NtrY